MENENIQTNTQAVEPKKKKGKKKWIIIAVIVVLFLAIASSGSSDEPTVETIAGETSSTEGSSSNSTTEVNTDVENTEEETTQAQTNEIKAGSSVTNDEVKISYKSCNVNFKKYSQYADIKNGYKVVQAVFDFENISETDISLNGFACYADGVKCDSFYYVDDYSDPILQTISAGRKLLDATVYYEVPADAELIELEYEIDYWSGEKYIFVIE